MVSLSALPAGQKGLLAETLVLAYAPLASLVQPDAALNWLL
jgi:hypothetical protein